jgi:hypothetical protein
MRDLDAFLGTVAELEPTDSEQELAAELELAAQQRGFALDSGESLLSAITIERPLDALLTGDKRAIVAIEELLNDVLRLPEIRGKLKCLEQAVLELSGQIGLYPIRAAVCGQPEVDKALTMCFSCLNAIYEEDSVREGLQSYVKNLRAAAPLALAP